MFSFKNATDRSLQKHPGAEKRRDIGKKERESRTRDIIRKKTEEKWGQEGHEGQPV